MTKRAATLPAHIEIVAAAAEQEPVLANLLQLYAHDFSEFHDVPMLADGRFAKYKPLHLYWSEADQHPLLVMVDGKLAGFVFVKRGSEVSGDKNIWDVAEFFVLRGYRRRGVGTLIAHEVWKRFPGAWEVRVMEANVSGCRFWDRAIAAFTGAVVLPVRVEKDGQGWKVFSFESQGLSHKAQSKKNPSRRLEGSASGARPVSRGLRSLPGSLSAPSTGRTRRFRPR